MHDVATAEIDARLDRLETVACDLVARLAPVLGPGARHDAAPADWPRSPAARRIANVVVLLADALERLEL